MHIYVHIYIYIYIYLYVYKTYKNLHAHAHHWRRNSVPKYISMKKIFGFLVFTAVTYTKDLCISV